MASDALRRLAARVSKTVVTPCASNIVQFEGSSGSKGSATPNRLEKLGFLATIPGTPGANLRGSKGSSRLDGANL